jgi:hypothetical protein
VKLLVTSVPQRLAERIRRHGFTDSEVTFSNGMAADRRHGDRDRHGDASALIYIEVPDAVAAQYQTGENRYAMPGIVANAYWRELSACGELAEFVAHAARLRGS